VPAKKILKILDKLVHASVNVLSQGLHNSVTRLGDFLLCLFGRKNRNVY